MSSNKKEGIMIIGFGVLMLLIVVAGIWSLATASNGGKMCAAKYGTERVVWSYPDKCYVLGGDNER